MKLCGALPNEWNRAGGLGPCDRPEGHDPAWLHCCGEYGWIVVEFTVCNAIPREWAESDARGRVPGSTEP